MLMRSSHLIPVFCLILTLILSLFSSTAAAGEIDDFFAAQSSDPNFVQHALAFGLKQNKEGNHEAALEVYNRLLTAYPANEKAAQFQVRKIKALVAMDRKNDADAAVETLFSTNQGCPEFIEHAVKAAWAYNGAGYDGKTDEIYMRLLTLFPAHEQAVWVQMCQSRHHLKKGDLDKAKAGIEILFSNFQNSPDYHRLNYRCYYRSDGRIFRFYFQNPL